VILNCDLALNGATASGWIFFRKCNDFTRYLQLGAQSRVWLACCLMSQMADRWPAVTLAFALPLRGGQTWWRPAQALDS
jgi:hypothetical protein